MSVSNPQQLYPELDWPAGAFAVKDGAGLFLLAGLVSLLGGLWGLGVWTSHTPLQLLARMTGAMGLLGLAAISFRIRGWLREPLQRPRAEIDPRQTGEGTSLPDTRGLVAVVVDATSASQTTLEQTLQSLQAQQHLQPELWVITPEDAPMMRDKTAIKHLQAHQLTQGVSAIAWETPARYLAFLKAGDQPTETWLVDVVSYLERKSRDGVFGPASQNLDTPAGWLAHGWEQFFPLGVEARRQAGHKTLLLPPTWAVCRRKRLTQAFNQVPDKDTPITWWDLSVALLRDQATLTLSNRPLGQTLPPESVSTLASRNLQETRQLIAALRHSSQHRSLTPPARGDLLAVLGRRLWAVSTLVGLLGGLLSGSWVMFLLATAATLLVVQGWKTVLEGAGGERPRARGWIARYLWATLEETPHLWR